ncbi:MAG: mobile mystery protein A [Treponema sp.]|nr:mobile mystery protein A [Spirochaetales bacterium]MDY3131815.1 mobile mystery protein A [Treponema sp.]MDY5919012.1 mobile mystery protein A [Treponema sp.]MDY6191024.1 mobile mystery protein A [Treponema sp.]
MNARVLQIRALDKKTSDLKSAKNIVLQSSGWIKTVREAIGMTVSQLAARLGVTQPRITKMESNEDNLKLSTMKKAAEAMNCEFVYYFKPRTTFQNLVDEQAQKKAVEVLKTVNENMALENQEIAEDEAVKDFASDLINTKIKQIWD